jgi:AAHS family 4-hydroxybenzoate transporter-like MFS transporter
MMNTSAVVDVRAMIDRGSVGRLQRLVLLLGFCIIALEGFDLAVMGFIVPVLRQQWHVSSHALGPALSAAQFGLVLGAVIAGPLADRFGRKTVLLGSVAIFGAFTLLTTTASDLPMLVLFRFLTGVGVGSVVPNAATLISEYMPERLRSLSIAFIICGVAFSSACAGFLSAWIIPAFGWRCLLVVGGLATLVMIPALLVALPESVRFLVAKRAPAARIRAIVEKMAPGETSAQSVFVASQEPAGRGETALVLSPAYRFGSFMLWLTYFAALFASNTLSNWLPSFIKESGYDFRSAATIAAVYQTGGVVGALATGWAMDRHGLHKVPAFACMASAALFLGLGLAFHSVPLMLLLAFALGFFLIGAICSVNALPTAYYPTRARATGSCWMHGAGRCGALLSVFSGAQMLSMGWSADRVFMALIAAPVVASAALLAKEYFGRGKE